jgi:hypothetical protein
LGTSLANAAADKFNVMAKKCKLDEERTTLDLMPFDPLNGINCLSQFSYFTVIGLV